MLADFGPHINLCQENKTIFKMSLNLCLHWNFTRVCLNIVTSKRKHVNPEISKPCFILRRRDKWNQSTAPTLSQLDVCFYGNCRASKTIMRLPIWKCGFRGGKKKLNDRIIFQCLSHIFQGWITKQGTQPHLCLKFSEIKSCVVGFSLVFGTKKWVQVSGSQ